jgi:hypothetical protein
VVDDNVFNIMTLQTMLEVSLKLKSDRALNGREAVELVKRRVQENTDEPCHCKIKK